MSGLYEFASTGATPYQYVVDGDAYLRKTATGTGKFKFYLASGLHTLTIAQDPAANSTSWSITVRPTAAASDSLPYSQAGSQLGGAGSIFTGERFPVYLLAPAAANFSLQVTGAATDHMQAYLYRPGEGSPFFTSEPVSGGETVWWPAGLTAGANEVKLVADAANGTALEYRLAAQAVPGAPQTWSGLSLKNSLGSTVQVELTRTATYRLVLSAPRGFAQLVVDKASGRAPLAPDLPASGHRTEVDVPLQAGTHSLQIVNASPEPETAWTLSVAEQNAPADLGRFSGTLKAHESVVPNLPMLATVSRDVNFRLQVTGADSTKSVSLAVTDGVGGPAFNGKMYSGEIGWGTATLKQGHNGFALANDGDADLDYDLAIYPIDTTPMDRAGLALATSGWNSVLKVNFPADGLYTFDLGAYSGGTLAGRYQLWVGDSTSPARLRPVRRRLSSCLRATNGSGSCKIRPRRRRWHGT